MNDDGYDGDDDGKQNDIVERMYLIPQVVRVINLVQVVYQTCFRLFLFVRGDCSETIRRPAVWQCYSPNRPETRLEEITNNNLDSITTTCIA